MKIVTKLGTARIRIGLVALALLATACGGGGSETGAATDAEAMPTTTVAPTTVPTAASCLASSPPASLVDGACVDFETQAAELGLRGPAALAEALDIDPFSEEEADEECAIIGLLATIDLSRFDELIGTNSGKRSWVSLDTSDEEQAAAVDGVIGCGDVRDRIADQLWEEPVIGACAADALSAEELIDLTAFASIRHKFSEHETIRTKFPTCIETLSLEVFGDGAIDFEQLAAEEPVVRVVGNVASATTAGAHGRWARVCYPATAHEILDDFQATAILVAPSADALDDQTRQAFDDFATAVATNCQLQGAADSEFFYSDLRLECIMPFLTADDLALLANTDRTSGFEAREEMRGRVGSQAEGCGGEDALIEWHVFWASATA